MADRTLEIKITGNTAGLSRSLGTAAVEADTFGKKVSGGATRAVGALGKAGALAGVAVGVGLVAGLKGALDAAGDFEQKLNVLKAVTGGTTDEMKDASKAAIKLGADAKLPAVSAQDAADAMLMLGKAGFTMRQSIAAARGTLLLVTAAETDAATAAKVVTQNIFAFGLKAKDTSKIVDQMAGFMNSTGTSFDAFTDSLSYVAAPAHAVGQSFAETAAQLEILSQKGIEGSMAGTGLRKMLNELVAGKAVGYFHDIGVETVTASGKFVGMRNLLQQLNPILETMTAPERLGLMRQAFGLTAMNQANILLGTAVGQYDAATASIEKKGQADKLAASHMQGYNGAMAQLGSALETIQIEIGLKLLPVATKLALWLTNELPVATAKATTAYNQDLKPALTDMYNSIKRIVDFTHANWGGSGGIGDIVAADMKQSSGAVKTASALMSGDWSNAWDGMKQTVVAQHDLIEAAMRSAIKAFTSAASSLGNAIVNGFSAGLSGMGAALESGLKAPINALIAGWNSLKFTIPGIDTHIPGVGKVGGQSVGVPHVTPLAMGGIVTRPTIALVGEAGPEAVIPLGRGGGGSMGNNYYITAPSPVDPRQIAAALAWQTKTAGAMV